MTDVLPSVEINPASAANASVIWLHGLGADGHDFEPVIPALGLPSELAVRFILPHAPSMPVTVNNGYVMPAWYDIIRFGEEREYNDDQLMASAKKVHALIDREIERGVPSHRIMLAGFSQGGAVNFQAGLTYPKPLAGILALSTYFPTGEKILPHRAQSGIPVQIYHGTADPVVPIHMARTARRHLERFGLIPDFRTYVMGHEVCLEELGDIAAVLKLCFSAPI